MICLVGTIPFYITLNEGAPWPRLGGKIDFHIWAYKGMGKCVEDYKHPNK